MQSPPDRARARARMRDSARAAPRVAGAAALPSSGMKLMAGTATVAALLGLCEGHGMLADPPSRNAFDRFLPGFKNGQSPQTPCTCPNAGVRLREMLSALWCPTRPLTNLMWLHVAPR